MKLTHLPVFFVFFSCASLSHSENLSINPCRARESTYVTKTDLVRFVSKTLPRNLMIRRNHSEDIFYLKLADKINHDGEDSFLLDIKSLAEKNSKNDKIEAVFSIPGKYEIYFADNVYTEPENTVSCRTYLMLESK